MIYRWLWKVYHHDGDDGLDHKNRGGVPYNVAAIDRLTVRGEWWVIETRKEFLFLFFWKLKIDLIFTHIILRSIKRMCELYFIKSFGISCFEIEQHFDLSFTRLIFCIYSSNSISYVCCKWLRDLLLIVFFIVCYNDGCLLYIFIKQ